MSPQRPYPLPDSGGSWGLPVTLALGVHALLVLALTWGVAWKQNPEPVLDAELWSALPQVAAPAPVEPPVEPEPEPEPPVEPEPPAPAPEPEPEPEPEPPPPPPPAKTPVQAKPDIAALKKAEDQRKAKEQATKDKLAKDKLAKDKAAKDKAAKDKAAKEQMAKKKQAEDKAKKDKLAKEKAVKEKEAKEKAEKAAQAKTAAEAQRREAQRKEQIERVMGQAGGSGNATSNSGPSASYGGRVAARIKPNVILADPVAGNPRAEVEVRADAEGKILSRRLVKSSGNAAWDQAVLRAIDRTGTLPRDTDGSVPSALIIGLRPQD